MRSQIAELDKQLGIELNATILRNIKLNHPAPDAIGIELLVPGGVQRIGEIDAASVAADFHHLRAAVQRLAGSGGMRGATYDAANVYRANQFGIKRIGDIILAHFSRAPAGSVQKAIIHRKIDIRKQRRHGFEALQQRRQLARFRGLSRNLDDFLYLEFPVRSSTRAMPQPDGTGKILQRYNHTDKTVSLRGIVGRAQL